MSSETSSCCSSSLTSSDWQKNLVRVFHPVIVEQLSEASRLLPHLGQLIPFDKMRAIRIKESDKPADAVEMLLECLLSSTDPDWFTIFKEALQKTKYMPLYKKLCMEDVKNTEKYEDLLKCNLDKLTDDVQDVTGILLYLCQHDVITKSDMIQIEAEKSNKGSWSAMLYLLLTLPCRHEDWFYHMIKALQQRGYHQLISEIHPDLAKAESLESMDRVVTVMPQLKSSSGQCCSQYNPLYVPAVDTKGQSAVSVNRETVPKSVSGPVIQSPISRVTPAKTTWQSDVQRRPLDGSVCEDGGDDERSPGEFDFRSTVGEHEFDINRLDEISLQSDRSARAGGQAVASCSSDRIGGAVGNPTHITSRQTGNTNSDTSRAPDVEKRDEHIRSGLAARSQIGARSQYSRPPDERFASPAERIRETDPPITRQNVPTAASCPTVFHQRRAADAVNSVTNSRLGPVLTTRHQAAQSVLVNDDSFEVRCAKCDVLALRSSDIHVIQGSHHVVMDDSFTQRIEAEPHYSPKSFGPWNKTHKIACKACRQDWGIKGTYKGLECCVVKSSGFKFVRGELCFMGKSWESIKIPFVEFSRDDFGILKRRTVTSTNFAYNSY